MVTTVAPVAGAGDGGRHVERMARAGGASLVGAGVSAVAGVALTVLITNGFDQDTAGTIFATTSLFLIATAVVQLGTDIGLVRWLPALMVTGEHHRVRPILRIAGLPVLCLAVAAAAVGFLFSHELAGVIAPDADQAALARQVQVLSVFLPVAAVYNTVLAATRGYRTMAPTVVVDSFGRDTVQLVAVGGAILLGMGSTAVVAAWAIPYAAALVVSLLWLGSLLRGRVPVSDDVPSDRAGSASAADFWRYTTPRAIGTISQVVLKRSDIVLLAALRSPRDAALYAAATRFVVFGQLGVQALQRALSPQLSALFARGDRASAREVYRATTAWAMLLAWPVYLACAVLAPDLLKVFGHGYGGVVPVVVMLCLAMLAATACGAVDTVLLMSGHTWLSLGNNLFALALNVGLNLVLIPEHGALGAGIAHVVSTVVRNLLPLVEIAWMYHISPVGRETALVAVTSVAAFGVLPGALRLMSVSTVWVVAALLLGGVAYLAAMWRLRVELQLGAFTAAIKAPRRRARQP